MIDLSRPADEVAPLLLGAVLRHGPVAVRLTEVEAYLGEEDAASHAFRGPTPRCKVMFGPAGRLYVYASYGIHRAGNLVCGPDGVASAVLLRGGYVCDGHAHAHARRREGIPHEALARGPGNLGAALGLDLELNGSVVEQAPVHVPGQEQVPGAGATSGFTLTPPLKPVEDYACGPRIGITKNADAPLRFWVPGDKTVSSPRGRPRAPRMR